MHMDRDSLFEELSKRKFIANQETKLSEFEKNIYTIIFNEKRARILNAKSKATDSNAIEAFNFILEEHDDLMSKLSEK